MIDFHRKNIENSLQVSSELQIGKIGGRTLLNEHGGPFEKITVKMEMHGISSRMKCPGHMRIAGMKMD